MDDLQLYRSMARARAFELAQADLWKQGLISGEMHLGTGEEAVAAGVAAQLRRGDAVALDHRPTPMLLLLGVDPASMLREMLGRADGLCGGNGGHMHLMSAEHLAAASGIVGSAAPLAAGFGLAAKRLRPGAVAVGFFGDGAINQGMLLESLNLAVVWRLPVVFVCKQNGWAITTRASATTGGDLIARARGFGLRPEAVDGADACAVCEAAASAVERARRKEGPSFLIARCARMDGHFLGDPLLAVADSPLSEDGRGMLGAVLSQATARGGGGLGERLTSLARVTATVAKARFAGRADPLRRARRALGGKRRREVERIDAAAAAEMRDAVQAARQEVR